MHIFASHVNDKKKQSFKKESLYFRCHNLGGGHAILFCIT